MTPVLGLPDTKSEILSDYQPFRQEFNFQQITRMLLLKQAEHVDTGKYILTVLRDGVESRVLYTSAGPNIYKARADLTSDEIISHPENDGSLQDAVERELQRMLGEPLFEPN